MNVKAYMCVVNSDSYSDVEVITSNNYLELIYKVIDNIMDTLGDDYPALAKFQVPNSIDFISDYDEEDYRHLLNEILYFLSKNGSSYKAKILELDQEIDQEHLVSILTDAIQEKR